MLANMSCPDLEIKYVQPRLNPLLQKLFLVLYEAVYYHKCIDFLTFYLFKSQ